MSGAETENGNEPVNDNDRNNANNNEEVESDSDSDTENKNCTKEDFVAKKHGKEREPWVQKSMPFPNKKHKSKEEEHYNKFCEWMKPFFFCKFL